MEWSDIFVRQSLNAILTEIISILEALNNNIFLSNLLSLEKNLVCV